MSKYLKLNEDVLIEREVAIQDILYVLPKLTNSTVKNTISLEKDIRNSKDEDLIELMLLAYKWWNI